MDSGPSRLRRAPEWQVWTALLIVYIVWGSTYLAISVVDETMPPLLTAGVRHLAAGVILWLFLMLRHGRGAFHITRSRAGRRRHSLACACSWAATASSCSASAMSRVA